MSPTWALVISFVVTSSVAYTCFAWLPEVLRDVAGALGIMAGVLGGKGANIVNLQLVHRDGSFHTFHVDVEVHDLAHLHAILAALRAADQVSSAERI